MSEETKNYKPYEFRLYPTKEQAERLDDWLKILCEIYNSALRERRDAWQLNKISISYIDQNRQITEIKEIREDVKSINSHAVQDALRRLDKSYKAFFREVKKGNRPGYPKFKKPGFFNSFTVPNTRYKITGNKISLSRFGNIKIVLDREIEGELKSLTIKRDIDQYYAIITAEFEPETLPPSDRVVGIDFGVQKIACLSDGTQIENPKFHKQLENKLRIAHRKVSRRKKGSQRRKKAAIELAKLYRRLRRCRKQFQHEVTTRLVKEFGIIIIEDLDLATMIANGRNTKPNRKKNNINKAMTDVAIGSMVQKLEYKSQYAGRKLIKVDPIKEKTAQICICGHPVKKTLISREVFCPNCGRLDDKGFISSNVIKSAGLKKQNDI